MNNLLVKLTIIILIIIIKNIDSNIDINHMNLYIIVKLIQFVNQYII